MSGPIVVVALAVLAGSSAACFRTDTCGQPPVPNGRNQELLFAVELGFDMSEGLTQDLLIPERVDGSRADTWRLTEPFKTTNESCDDPFIADFADTTLEATGDDVLQVVEVKRLGPDYVVTVRCAPGPYPVETQITGNGGVSRTTQRSGLVEVRLFAGGELRYRDAYGVRCWQADEMRLIPGKTTLVVGETTSIYHDLYTHWEHEPLGGETQTVRQELVGAGLVILGDLPPIAADRDYGTFLPVVAVRPGQDPTIAAGTLAQVVMLTVTE